MHAYDLAAACSLILYGFLASPPARAETLSDPALGSPVLITRDDEAGIVSIAARSETDMAFAQGLGTPAPIVWGDLRISGEFPGWRQPAAGAL